MSKYLVIITAFIVLWSGSMHSKEISIKQSAISKEIDMQKDLISNVIKQEKNRRQLALELAVIKTQADLVSLSESKSALDLLSVSAKERFVNSVVFGDNGITGFSYTDLEAELTPTQIYSVLKLFGAQHTVSKFEHARIESAADAMLLNSNLEYIKIPTGNMPISNLSGTVSRADHKGYACTGRATCSESQGQICMSGC
jgi:hypothetical protein